MAAGFFTIGHSNRSLEEFLGLLDGSGVELLVDVRSLPGSRAQPQFDQDELRGALELAGKRYEWVQALGGRRPVSRTVPFEVNALWRNRSFHNYADWALGDEFAEGLARVREWGHEAPLALMCSEAVWWRCHRRLLADHLIAHDEPVAHILGRGHVDEATLTPGAVVQPDHEVVYPPQAADSDPQVAPA